MKKDSFEWLVNRCSNHPRFLGSQARGGIPVEIQVATVLWRFSSTHYGYAQARRTLGISDGSYGNFTKRFLDAMIDASADLIQWPTNDPIASNNIAQGFSDLSTPVKKILPNVVGAMDGKLVVIQKPAKDGNAFVDRKNNPSLSLMAVCDASTKFLFIHTGDSGNKIP
jgi:hypothetical protein